MKRTGIIAGVLVVLIVAAAAVLAMHGGNVKDMTTAASNAAQSTAVATDQVNIENFMFSPMTIKVKKGTTVTWTNKDAVHHNVVADNPGPDAPNGPLIGQGEHYSFTFKKAGTYTFHCAPHPYMHGTVIVTD